MPGEIYRLNEMIDIVQTKKQNYRGQEKIGKNNILY